MSNLFEHKKQLNNKLNTIRTLYVFDLPNKINNIKQAWQNITNIEDIAGMRHLRILLHSLAGSTGSFGLPHIQQQAEQLESMLNHITFNNEQQQLVIEEQLKQMQTAAILANQNNLPLTNQLEPNITSRYMTPKRRILIVEDDPDQGNELSEQLTHYGYDVLLLQQIEQLSETLSNNTFHLVLCDIMHQGHENAGFEAIIKLKEHHIDCKQIPVLFFSARDDLDARLSAIRAGGIGYFQKPVHLGELIDRIEQLIHPPIIERSPQVLLVDDDTSLSQYHALLLEESGIQTMILNDPSNLIETIKVFNPDLVLMDLYFPTCTGVELAGVIRQQNAYLGIPILFLSIEKEVSEHLLAYQIGADDFLTKPINPNHFVPLVTQKIKRFRQLRDLMLHDSLTGAFNHTSIKNMMDTEIARSTREGQNMVVAMLDIDWFKKVNDTYGHPAGDRVLRDLSHLLHRRLRHTDYVGRYGGEEFMIVLGKTDIYMASTLLNTIREHFAQIIHEEADSQFRVTFSAGLAQLSDVSDGSQLISASDDALYQAKEAGRNRIFLAA